MNEVVTYVGIDAHKKDLFIAMLDAGANNDATWQRTIALLNPWSASLRLRP